MMFHSSSSRDLALTRPLDDRAYNFCKKYSDSIMLVDCEDFDMTGIAESVREYFAPLVAGAVLRSLADEFAYQRGHDLGVRRYMWKMEYQFQDIKELNGRFQIISVKGRRGSGI